MCFAAVCFMSGQPELPATDEPTKVVIDTYGERIVQKCHSADMAILDRLKRLMQKTKLHFELQDHLHEGLGENALKPYLSERKFRLFAKLSSPEQPKIVKQKLSIVASRLANRPALEFVVEIRRPRGPARTSVFFFKAQG